jgi:DNA-binding YbaB/EbfC family protein
MNIQKMMKQAQEMQAKIATMQQKLEEAESEGSAGGGAVKLTISGKKLLKKITIDDSLMVASEKEMLEDLIVAAFNDASNKVDQLASEQMGQMTAGLGLPPGMKLPF